MPIPFARSSFRRAIVIALSGPVAGGKSRLAHGLVERFGAARLSTRGVLMQRLPSGEKATRLALQRVGARRDEETGGSWVSEELGLDIFRAQEQRQKTLPVSVVIVDSVRIAGQVDGLRESFGRSVKHVHVTASEATRSKRYELRQARQEFEEAESYAEVIQDPTEKAVETLADVADIVVDTDRDNAADVVTRVAAQLGLLDRSASPSVDVLIGGQYGSEGKGNIAYQLAPEYDLLIRVGGPNAAHKVPRPSGEYTHFLLPSGTQAGTAQLLIGPGAVLDLELLQKEIGQSDVDYKRLSIDPQAMIITEDDKEGETELRQRISSTKSGAGTAAARRLLREKNVQLARDISDLDPYRRPATDVLEHAYSNGWRIMLEGTQGSGLSLFHGQYPHVTSRDTNVSGCLSEAGIAPARVRKVVAVVRAYPIRVGGPSGPMAQEIDWETVESRAKLPDGTLTAPEAELTSKTKTKRRVGEFEWDLLRRTALLNSPTDIALTFADYVDAENANAWRYEQLTDKTLRFIDEIERVTGARVSLISCGFMQYSHRTLIDRRTW